jgi:hypothetical protein
MELRRHDIGTDPLPEQAFDLIHARLALCHAAAAMYEQLSALSDAELSRRGLSRAHLAQDVRAACDRSPRP